MKILMLSNLFPPDVLGGYELLAADIAQALRAKGHELHVLTTGKHEKDSPTWIHRRLSLVRPFGEAAKLERLGHMRAAKSQQQIFDSFIQEMGAPDIVLAMSLRRLGLHIPRKLEQMGIPVVYCFNDDWLLAHKPADGSDALRRTLWRILERGPLQARTWSGVRFEHAVYVSKALRESMNERGAPIPEGVVCWQGVNLSHFQHRQPAISPAPRLLFAGRLHRTKGCDVALEALSLLHKRNIAATLTIAGDGEERQRLQEQAIQLGVNKKVCWLGHVPREEMPKVYQQNEIFLFPCKWEEPAGLTYLEAMACGLPVVAQARGGAVELLRHTQNALVVDDSLAMARAVEQLLLHPEQAHQLSQAGLETVTKIASLDRYTATILRELESALLKRFSLQEGADQAARLTLEDTGSISNLSSAMQVLANRGYKQVSIDLSKIRILSADDLHLLAGSIRQTKGLRVALTGLNPGLRSVARFVHLEAVADICESAEIATYQRTA